MSNLVVIKDQYRNSDAFEKIFKYLLRYNYHNSNKKCKFSYGKGILLYSIEDMSNSFKMVKAVYGKDGGNLLHHFIVTVYDERGIEYEDAILYAKLIANELSNYLFEMGFQNAAFIHNDTKIIHIHFIFNSVNYRDGNKLMNNRSFYSSLLRFLKDNYFYTKWENEVIFKKSKEVLDMEEELWMI